MKWFHHECSARHDPKLQMLGAAHGPEGIGIYWSLLEELGQHSDCFRLRIIGRTSEEEEHLVRHLSVASSVQPVPVLPMKILAKNLFTSVRILRSVIDTCVHIGLFEQSLWQSDGILYSPSFEHRADDYTRRLKRNADNLRTPSVPPPNNVRTNSVETLSNVHPETDTAGEVAETHSRREGEKKMPMINTRPVDNSATKEGGIYLIEPNDELLDQYMLIFHATLQQWNNENPSHAIDWQPTVSELKKLFRGGKYEHKLTMCFHAYNLLGEKTSYPELVLRALHLMLITHRKSVVANPFGWIWTCLHGNDSGTKPWVQLLTSDEEHNHAAHLRGAKPQ